MRPATRRRTPLLLPVVALLLATTACSSSGGDDDGSDAGGDSFTERKGALEEPAGRDAADSPAEDAPQDFAYADSANLALKEDAADDAVARRIIAKGNVSLEADDVGDAAFQVTRIADQHGGEVTERETTTNDDGAISTARLLLRIPVAEFDRAFTELEDAPSTDLQSSNTGKEDVTTKVIDTQVRIRAQRRSLARVEQLLDRARSISDIIRIEGQLSSRQAALESLERRLTYLNDQTSMSTIAVNISLPPEEKKVEEDEPEEAGFVAGLEGGWDALQAFGTGVATAAGALLPFAVVLLILGAPLLVLVRRLRRRSGDAPDVGTPAGA